MGGDGKVKGGLATEGAVGVGWGGGGGGEVNTLKPEKEQDKKSNENKDRGFAYDPKMKRSNTNEI